MRKKHLLAIAGLACAGVVASLVFTLHDDKYPLELSGGSASFFNNYVVPIGGLPKSTIDDYNVFYGKDDGERIELYIRSARITSMKYFSSPESRQAPDLTKTALMNEYCRLRKHDSLLPSSREGTFISTREEGKALQLYYYDASGSTLFFGITVSPSSCDNYKPPLPHSRVDLVNQWRYPEQVITG
ncbi:hypothetical protein [Serratia sp. CY85251]|uniref:hypothetical protein n=1 Tax=Serratia sp. CY85251 TaxID=3383696 RepID=UPI003FA12B74